MKALVIHGPGKYGVETQWPDPQARAGWATVRVRFSGICGSDLARFARTGSYHHPMVLGHEFSGVVEVPAPGSKRFAKGAPVAVLPLIPCDTCEGCLSGEPFHCSGYQFLGSRNDGGFAEYCLVPEENLFPLPPTVDLRVGAFLEPICVGLHVVRRSGVAAGCAALVFGAGSIGLLTGLWLRVIGASRIAFVDPRPESLAMARMMGFEEAYGPSDPALGAAGAFDAVFEAAGSGKALLGAIEMTRDMGVITVVGRDSHDTILPRESFERLMRKELRLLGCWGYNMRGEAETVSTALREGRFPVQPMITQEIPLEEAPRLISDMVSGAVYFCKAMISL